MCLNKFTVMKMRKEVKIGIFTVAILALLYWGINFLKGRDLFNRNMTYYAYYDNVSGIQMYKRNSKKPDGNQNQV